MSFRINNWTFAKKSDELKAIVWCPNCDGRIGIRTHEISPDGEVSPTLVCPHKGCNFREEVQLREYRKLSGNGPKGSRSATAAKAGTKA
jgi:hypothetical protein